MALWSPAPRDGPEAFADKTGASRSHRAEIISQRREAARRYTAVRAASARQRRDAVRKSGNKEVLEKVELKRDRPRILREQALQRLRGALLLTIVQQAGPREEVIRPIGDRPRGHGDA